MEEEERRRNRGRLQQLLRWTLAQHNTDAGTVDHSCSICGKCLSSASSLDRHMLVHSGERPYKCNVCGQTFTTNGNMHRRRPSVKRGGGGEEPPAKKQVEEVMQVEVRGEESCFLVLSVSKPAALV
ncbi:hypothetical protein F7725_014842 [Dissostichus mawsoni]|uniref:C2H2-type domain-containing protein n=1 Tax=Dissostichus mawsoni TaxID=36200 RepID=A0A7J5YG07_DISMA|nr:hypothetical protein F7725_014842 [Dissostichus mawsoni]